MEQTKKDFVGCDSLRTLSFQLGASIFDGLTEKERNGVVFLVGLWRGGSFIAICVDEFLSYLGVKTDCVAVRTSYYIVDQKKKDITVHSLDYLKSTVKPGDLVVLLDDVWDSGTSIQKVRHEMLALGANVKIAVIHYKPTNSKFPLLEPDHFVKESNDWIVYPHELVGLSEEEIDHNYGSHVLQLLKARQRK